MPMVTRAHHSSRGAWFRIDFGDKAVEFRVAHDPIPEDLAARPWQEFYKPIFAEIAAAIGDPQTIWRDGKPTS